jgi:hypothetical protein
MTEEEQKPTEAPKEKTVTFTVRTDGKLDVKWDGFVNVIEVIGLLYCYLNQVPSQLTKQK